MFSRKEVTPARSYFNELTERHTQHDNNTSFLSHTAIALYVEHCIAQNERWFVLGGSEDLRALLSRVELNDKHNELFILIRPYIHSMGLYLRCDSGQIKAYLFDSQSWGVRDNPTQLIIEAIQKQYPTADILLSGTELQLKYHQSGCEQFALALLQWAASMDPDAPVRNGQRLFTTYATKKKAVDGYQNVYQQSQNELPERLLSYGVSQNPNWHVQQRKEDIEVLETCLKKGYLVNDALDWKKIMSVVKKRQGVGLPLCTRFQSSLYEIILDEKTLKIVFKTNGMLLNGNLFSYSQALYPFEVRIKDIHYILQSPEIIVDYDPNTLTLTYKFQAVETLLAAIQSLQNPEELEKLYWNNMRQLAGLEELLYEIKLKIDLHNAMKNTSGGFDLRTTLSALSELFEGHKEVYVPSYHALSGVNASLSLNALSSQRHRYIALPCQANDKHQVAVWVDIEQKTVSIINSDSSTPCSSDSLSHLEKLLGIPQSDFTYPKPVETQSDDWSCGIHVVRNLMAMRQLDTAFTTPAERTEYYLRAAHYYNRKAQKQHEMSQTNEQTLRQLLLLVETFRYQKGYFQAGTKVDSQDVFKTLADYLQGIVWGNLDRQASPENNTGRNNESQSLLLTQSLRDICTSYRSKRDNYGLFILQMAGVFAENNKDLNKVLPAILNNTMLTQPLGLNGMLAVPSNRGYKDALDVLISEIGMYSKDKSPLDLFHILTSCIQTRDSIQDNQKFLEEFLLNVLGDAGYNSYISTVIKTKVDSFLYDFLAFLANHYLGINESKLSTLKSHEAERLAFLQREQEKAELLTLLEASGVSIEEKYANSPRFYACILFIQKIIKNGCLNGLTRDEIKCLFEKLVQLDPGRRDIENLLTLYSGKNTRTWENLMLEALNKISAKDIAAIEINGESILLSAEVLKLSSLTESIVGKAGLALLELASKSGNPYVLKILIQHGINVNAVFGPITSTSTPLICATSGGHTATVELLLDAGANPDATATNGDTALSLAARGGHTLILKLLLEKLLADELGFTSALRETDVTTIYDKLPLIPQLIKDGCLKELTPDEIKSFFDKVLQLQPNSRNIEKLLSLYPGKNTNTWDRLMVQALDKMTADDIADAKIDGTSILIGAEERKLSSLVKSIVNKAGVPLLKSASQFGNLQELKILIKHMGVNIIVDSCESVSTPLVFAAAGSHAASVALLLAAGAHLNTPNGYGYTPLFYAADNGDSASVKLLLDAGANPVATNSNGETAFSLAARNGHTLIIKQLLEKLLVDEFGIDALREVDVMRVYNQLPSIPQLVKDGCLKGLTRDEIKSFFDKVLQLKSGSNDIENLLSIYPGKNTSVWENLMVQALHNMTPEQIVDVKINGTSILIGAEEWKLSILRDHVILTAKGHLLKSACTSGNLHELEILIQHGVNVNVVFPSSLNTLTTPLGSAIINDHIASVEMLLAAGANPDAKMKYGMTPLSVAAGNGNKAVVKLLLAAGANPNLADKYGETAFSVAVRANYTVIIQDLLAAGAIPNVADRYGETALSRAARYDDTISLHAFNAAEAGNTLIGKDEKDEREAMSYNAMANFLTYGSLDYKKMSKIIFWGKRDNNKLGDAHIAFEMFNRK